MPQTSPMNWMIMFSSFIFMMMAKSMITSKSFSMMMNKNNKMIFMNKIKWSW